MPEQTTPQEQGQGVNETKQKVTLSQLNRMGLFARGYVIIGERLFLYLYVNREHKTLIRSRKIARKDGVVIRQYLLTDEPALAEWVAVIEPCSPEYPAEIEIESEDGNWLFYWDGKEWKRWV